MGIGYAIGAGFFQRRQQIVDEERDEARDRRKMAMEVWMKDTLPRAQAARAQDTKVMNMTNELLGMDEFKDLPMTAFHAAKAISQGRVKNEQEYIDLYRLSGRNFVPPEVIKEQQELASKSFVFDGGKVSLRPTETTQQVRLPEQNNRSTLSTLFGTGRDENANLNEAADQFQGATGQDPMSAQITPQTDVISGQAVGKRVDARSQEIENVLIKYGLENSQNPAEFMSALINPDMPTQEAITKFADVASKSDQLAQEFNLRTQQAIVTNLVNNMDTLTDEGKLMLRSAVSSPKGITGDDLAVILGNRMTPEQIAAERARLDLLKPGSTLGWLALINDQTLLANAFPDPADRQRVADAVRMQIDQANMTNQQKILESLGATAAQTAAAQSPTQTTRAPIPEIDDPLPDIPEEEDTSQQQALKENRDDNEEVSLRPGEAVGASGTFIRPQEVSDIALNGDSDALSQANPRALFGALEEESKDRKYKQGGRNTLYENRGKEVIKAAVFTEDDIQYYINNVDDYQKLDNTITNKIGLDSVTFKTKQDAVDAGVQPGQIYRLEGQDPGIWNWMSYGN